MNFRYFRFHFVGLRANCALSISEHVTLACICISLIQKFQRSFVKWGLGFEINNFLARQPS